MKLWKTLGFVFLASLLAKTSFAADEINPYGAVLKGDDVTVEMAYYTAENGVGLHDVLLKIKGAPAFDAGIDGKVMKYTAAHGGTGVDFQFEKDGSTHNRMSSRKPWGDWDEFEVYFGNKTFKVYKDAKATKKVSAKDLLSEYNKTKK